MSLDSTVDARMRPKDLALLFTLGAIWGASFLFIRVAAPVFGPLVLVLARTLLAGLALAPFVASDERAWLRSRRRRVLVMGLFGSALPFVLISAAELAITASVASVLNATTPMFTAVVAAVAIGDDMPVRRVVGLVSGLFGVAIVVGLSELESDIGFFAGVAAMLAASLSYGIGAVYTKRHFSGAPAATVACGQQLAAAVLVAPFALVSLPTAEFEWRPALAVVALAVLCTAIAYLIYLRILAVGGPTSAMSVTLIVPVFGVAWSWLFLDESLSWGAFAGAVVIVASVLAITDVRRELPASSAAR